MYSILFLSIEPVARAVDKIVSCVMMACVLTFVPVWTRPPQFPTFNGCGLGLLPQLRSNLGPVEMVSRKQVIINRSPSASASSASSSSASASHNHDQQHYHNHSVSAAVIREALLVVRCGCDLPSAFLRDCVAPASKTCLLTIPRRRPVRHTPMKSAPTSTWVLAIQASGNM